MTRELRLSPKPPGTSLHARENLPQLTAAEARKSLLWAAERLELEFIEIEGVHRRFYFSPYRDSPTVVLFATWHAEVLPVHPAAAEGAERLALSATLAGLGERWGRRRPPSVVVAPGSTQGSLVLAGS